MKNKELINQNEWVTLQEASERSIYSKRQIRKLSEKGKERIGTKRIGNNVLYSMKDIIQYAASHQEQPILDTVWDELSYTLPGECFYPLRGYDNKYFVSNMCRVYNATTGQLLTPTPKVHKGIISGYSAVGLMQNGKCKNVILHRLIGQTQCPNVLRKDIYHHINLQKKNGLFNNSASNLLPVWKHQHDELHRLLSQNKMEEYKKMVADIKKENKQKLYIIPHLDFEDNDKFRFLMYVNAAGYKEYKKSGDVPLDCIIMERAERR